MSVPGRGAAGCSIQILETNAILKRDSVTGRTHTRGAHATPLTFGYERGCLIVPSLNVPEMLVDRCWLLTSTFYGNWLPGDSRGFVSRVTDERPEDTATTSRRKHGLPGTPYDADLRGLRLFAEQQMRGPSIRISEEQAKSLLKQFQETARVRSWHLFAVAIMTDHVHIVVGVIGDPDPTKVLGDFKAYGSRALNKSWGVPPSETWWTYAGSKRVLVTEQSLRNAIHYVLFKQPRPLVVWSPQDNNSL